MIWPALILGLVGSLHCAGMCSPLLVAVTVRQSQLHKKVVYNLGRTITYGILGGLAALFGSLIGFGHYQQIVSIAFGILLLAIAFGKMGLSPSFAHQFLFKIVGPLKKLFGKALGNHHLPGLFLLGMLNGILPCGLTMLAIGYCFVMPSLQDGMLFMLVFGLGTWPVMLGFTQFIQLILNKINVRLNKVVVGAMVLSGLLLIGRGILLHNHQSPITSTTPAASCK
ncbi:MAG: sulfite exporter TauE/SafE family protein [Bacteroidota bacterium]|jgi:sulfite exporter TauE/SafE|nr:sulfite exporter TauE/SafE family protein [Cytophagales bacterium]MCE2955702.1 sulfite exporter TauE/SafE family protein [Flammeovirgaceae bacterium]MCZ8070710.1 sulfite exporter TauE/SafE family protein [Cytophagales bacterium]